MELSINYVPSGKVLSCALQYVAGSRICIEGDVQGSFAKARTMPGGVNDIKYSATDEWYQWNYLSMELSINLSMYLSMELSINLSLYKSI